MYQYAINFRDNKTGKTKTLYAPRSQIGNKQYASTCMNNKLEWLKDRADTFNRDITILSTTLNKA